MKKRRIYPTTLLLFGFMAVVTLADLVNPVRAFSEMENRELKTTSQFSLSNLFKGDFQSQYEKVVADQFVGRDEWITLKSMTESALLKTENNGVIYGKNGALFGKLTSYNETTSPSASSPAATPIRSTSSPPATDRSTSCPLFRTFSRT